MNIFGLLVVFQVKHFLADYILQFGYQLGKFKKSGWVGPLSLHCGIHAVMTAVIAAAVSRDVKLTAVTAVFDFVSHFLMDRVKASPDLMGRWQPLSKAEYVECKRIDVYGSVARYRLKCNQLFWYCLGFDQAWHHLTHYFIIWSLV